MKDFLYDSIVFVALLSIVSCTDFSKETQDDESWRPDFFITTADSLFCHKSVVEPKSNELLFCRAMKAVNEWCLEEVEGEYARCRIWLIDLSSGEEVISSIREYPTCYVKTVKRTLPYNGVSVRYNVEKSEVSCAVLDLFFDFFGKFPVTNDFAFDVDSLYLLEAYRDGAYYRKKIYNFQIPPEFKNVIWEEFF